MHNPFIYWMGYHLNRIQRIWINMVNSLLKFEIQFYNRNSLCFMKFLDLSFGKRKNWKKFKDSIMELTWCTSHCIRNHKEVRQTLYALREMNDTQDWTESHAGQTAQFDYISTLVLHNRIPFKYFLHSTKAP